MPSIVRLCTDAGVAIMAHLGLRPQTVQIVGSGTALPSTRSLASQLGISRGLVVGAYAQFGAEGYLVLRRGAPPRVSRAVGHAPAPVREALEKPARHNLRPDLPDYAGFPREEWVKSYRAALKSASNQELAYGDVRGSPALRSALLSYLGRVRGVAGDPEHTFSAVAGFAQAAVLVCTALRRLGTHDGRRREPGACSDQEIVARTGYGPCRPD